ncbi:MAG: hypothetical protein ACE366_00360 [Bradymonadia bacterium]
MFLLVHAASTWALVGLIWTIQMVHYPLFAQVGPEGFTAYHHDHTRLITFVVGPLMLAEAFTTAALVFMPDALPSDLKGAAWVGAILLAVVWLTTAFISVPCHNQLAGGFNAHAHDKLVSTNWIRTIAWTARGALVLWIFNRTSS